MVLFFSVLYSSLASPVPVWVQSPKVLLERLAVCVCSRSCRRLFSLRSDFRPAPVRQPSIDLSRVRRRCVRERVQRLSSCLHEQHLVTGFSASASVLRG
jgi:hypothetical protein